MHEQESESKNTTDKDYTVIVNGRQKKWLSKTISFDQIVVLAFGIVQNNIGTVYTITYSKGQDKKPEGMMVKGESIIVKDEMMINVTATNKS